MNYSKNLTYFIGTGSTVLMILGGILAFVGVMSIKGTPFGFVLIGLGIWAASAGMEKWPVTDSDYDKEVNGYLSNLKSIALNKLGVDESEVSEVAPIIFGGYEFDDVEKVKKGEDGKWRSNIYKVVALFFSAHELHCYTLRFNTLRREDTEGTEVYFYEDIVSVSTFSANYKVKIGEQEVNVNHEAFKLTTRGGTSFTVNISDAQKAQESVNAMRALLREKKQA